MNYIKLFTIAALLFCLTNIYAQSDFRPGYIITNNKDTINGLIQYTSENNLHKRCVFKVSVDSDKKEYKPSDIIEFQFTDSKFYRSILNPSIADENVFVEVLLDGFYNLYYYLNNDFSSYYMETDDGKLWEMPVKLVKIEKDGKIYQKQDNRYKGVLYILFQDCPEIKPLIDRTKLDHKSLIKVTKEYLSRVCSEEICIIYERKPPAFKLNIIPLVGYNKNNHTLSIIPTSLGDNYDKVTYSYSSNSFFLGLGINLKLPRIIDNFSIYATGHLYNESFSTLQSSMELQRVTNYILDVNDKKGIGTFSFRYLFPGKFMKPYISGGVFYQKTFDRDLTFVKESEMMDGEFFTQTLPINDYSPSLLGLVADIGVELRITDNNSLMLNCSIYNASGNTPEVEEKSKGLKFIVGYIF
ncbi:hypothetical protein [Carboxylicivirga sp. RSCT41]|uniref:hypothetical protein n=1 Tax=Carboxylicivirga agarovorans TaxID=3417570 RepID=UPI003D358AB2